MSETTKTTSRAAEFRQMLAHRAIVADGAMGTMLYARGNFINRCFAWHILAVGFGLRLQLYSDCLQGSHFPHIFLLTPRDICGRVRLLLCSI